MNTMKMSTMIAATYLLTIEAAHANGVAVPEIDGAGAIIGLGLVVGLAALIREKFYRN